MGSRSRRSRRRNSNSAGRPRRYHPYRSRKYLIGKRARRRGWVTVPLGHNDGTWTTIHQACSGYDSLAFAWRRGWTLGCHKSPTPQWAAVVPVPSGFTVVPNIVATRRFGNLLQETARTPNDHRGQLVGTKTRQTQRDRDRHNLRTGEGASSRPVVSGNSYRGWEFPQ